MLCCASPINQKPGDSTRTTSPVKSKANAFHVFAFLSSRLWLGMRIVSQALPNSRSASPRPFLGPSHCSARGWAIHSTCIMYKHVTAALPRHDIQQAGVSSPGCDKEHELEGQVHLPSLPKPRERLVHEGTHTELATLDHACCQADALRTTSASPRVHGTKRWQHLHSTMWHGSTVLISCSGRGTCELPARQHPQNAASRNQLMASEINARDSDLQNLAE